ncbi:MAG: nucleoside phosphorylase [Bacteroidales bacterium]
MMYKPNPAELVTNPDGSVYHLKLHRENLAETVILVGDPGRVPAFSKYFDSIEFQGSNREITTHTGRLGSQRITVLSTGMGTDNIDIVVNELDALVNIDFSTREEYPQKTRLKLIRIGTTGSLQPDIPVNSFIRSDYSIGIDTVLNFYTTQGCCFEHELAEAFRTQCDWPASLGIPYAVKAGEDLARHFSDVTVGGVTLTAPGFYGPQGRRLRLPLAIPDMNERIGRFSFRGLRITNFEMETAALYGLASLLGHEALTICLAIANRPLGQFNDNYKPRMDELIRLVLEKISTLP